MEARLATALALAACVLAGAGSAWAGQAAGCMGCHDIHNGSTAACTQCHSVDLTVMLHPNGPGTPIENMYTDPNQSCLICHAPQVLHVWRINTSAVYSAGPNADWLDVDQACGQCHGGGTDPGQNPTSHDASYKSKTTLAFNAAGLHSGRPSVPPMIMFGYTTSGLTVNVDASASSCSGSSANCNRYDWDWGDGSPHGSDVVASHAYATADAWTITLTVEEEGVSGGITSQVVTVYAVDSPPVVDGAACGSILDANTWTATLSDTSTDDNGVDQVTVSWGDGTMLSSDTTAPFGPFTHTYLNAGTFPITHKAIDTIGQQSARTCAVSPVYFTIGGTVYRSNGTTAVSSATVTVKKGLTVVKTVYTAGNGTFSVGSLKPGTYTLTVTKSGFTFAVPAASITVGPASAGNKISALAP